MHQWCTTRLYPSSSPPTMKQAASSACRCADRRIFERPHRRGDRRRRRQLARTAPAPGRLARGRYHVRCLHRAGKLGLSSAVIDGWATCSTPIIGVMDADFSHDPAIIPRMLAAIRGGECDLAIGSRYVPGGGITNWPLAAGAHLARRDHAGGAVDEGQRYHVGLFVLQAFGHRRRAARPHRI